jgi:hypothetical protein
MSQQERRLKDGMRADGVEPKSDATKDLIEYGQILLNGIGALQSADYVGDPDSARSAAGQARHGGQEARGPRDRHAFHLVLGDNPGMLAFVQADISLHSCDAIFFTRPEDWPERIRPDIPGSGVLEAQKAVPGWVRQMADRKAQTDPEQAKLIVWEPGRLYCWKGPQKRVIFPCLGEEPDYGSFRDCLSRLRDTWPKFGIKSIAMPPIGPGYGLDWKVMRDMLVHFFAEPNPPANEEPKGLHVEVYEVDVPGWEPTPARS